MSLSPEQRDLFELLLKKAGGREEPVSRTAGNLPGRGCYVRANGLNIYYIVQGAGEPLILLHGGAFTSQMWEPHMAVFAKHFQVIALDSRGHGNTDNPAGTLSYHGMADDVAAFIRTVRLNKPYVCGWSDGGQIALDIGMRYADLVRGLVISAACYRFSEGYVNWAKALGMEGPGRVNTDYIEREMPDLALKWRELHAPRGPGYWKTLLTQLSSLWLTPVGYTSRDFAMIGAPTLILSGDRDTLVPIEDAVELFRLIPWAELGIIPNAPHSFPETRVELFTDLILDFLSRRGTV